MTIKEMEQRCGMSRANIRFYEQEGLLTPQRQSNGYREYSEDDLRQLQRILLLRTLGLGLDEIRALQKGEASLDTVLSRQADTLEQQAAQSRQRAQLCRQIRQNDAQYSTLDGRRWLDALEAEEPAAVAVPQTDTCYKVTAPWRRFFARCFDLTLYSTVWILLGFALLRAGPSTQTFRAWSNVSTLTSALLMLFLEPLFLCTWGTTPGKWLLGLRVRDNTGRKLSYSDSLSRTVQALWHGLGFFIPIYSLVRLYRSYYDCSEYVPLAWEQDSELHLKDQKVWRIGAFIGGHLALFGVILLAGLLSAAPVHRGDMTVSQFAENYNRLSLYYGYDFQLDEEGRWTGKQPDGSFVFHVSDEYRSDFTYHTQDGLMTGLTLSSTSTDGEDSWLQVDHSRRVLAILAFTQAYDPTPLNNDEAIALVQKLQSNPFAPLDETLHGVHITWELTASGYRMLDSILIPIEGQTPSCTMTFTMEKVS